LSKPASHEFGRGRCWARCVRPHSFPMSRPHARRPVHEPCRSREARACACPCDLTTAMPAPGTPSGGRVSSLVIAHSPTLKANARFTRDSALSQGCPRSNHGELSRNGDRSSGALVARSEARMKDVRARPATLARDRLKCGGAWADGFCGQFLESRFELPPPRGGVDAGILAGDFPQSPQAF
jgi:hypothetical protein